MTKTTLEEKGKEHYDRNCLFCQFAEEIDNEESKVAKRRVKFKGKNKRKWDNVCFAILDLSPKILGHSLVIARIPFNDFTDDIPNKNQEKLTIYEATVWLANRIKDVLKAKSLHNVYV